MNLDPGFKTAAGLLITSVLVCAVYWLALLLYRRARYFPLLHPLASGSLVLALGVMWLYPDYPEFQQQSALFYLFLGPATVALALPLFNEFSRIRAIAKPLAITLVSGAAISPLVALSLAWLLGGAGIYTSLATKSVTTPIALGIAEKIGSIPALAAGAVIFTGVAGALMGAPLLKLMGIKDERILGAVLGINAHGVGAASAFQVSARCGAFASLAMGITGVVTAVLLPLIIMLLK